MRYLDPAILRLAVSRDLANPTRHLRRRELTTKSLALIVCYSNHIEFGILGLTRR